jgi:hypothetical protein
MPALVPSASAHAGAPGSKRLGADVGLQPGAAKRQRQGQEAEAAPPQGAGEEAGRPAHGRGERGGVGRRRRLVAGASHRLRPRRSRLRRRRSRLSRCATPSCLAGSGARRSAGLSAYSLARSTSTSPSARRWQSRRMSRRCWTLG